jgi:hypothetical protein
MPCTNAFGSGAPLEFFDGASKAHDGANITRSSAPLNKSPQ